MKSVQDIDQNRPAPTTATRGERGTAKAISPIVSPIGKTPVLVKDTWLRTTLLGHAQENSPLREAYRLLRLNLQTAADLNPFSSVLFTSAEAGDGRSTAAANLAILVGEVGQSVLVIDAHLGATAARGVSLLAKDVTGFGLSDYLAGKADRAGVIQGSSAANVDVITAGTTSTTPGLLETERMEQLLQQTQGMYSLVVVDGPPCSRNVDAMVLAGLVEGVVVVLRSGPVQSAAIQEMRHRLKQVNARVLGAVLNAADGHLTGTVANKRTAQR